MESQTTEREYFSLADIGQYEEEVIEGYRGDIDANAARPPLSHDVYLMNVKYAETDSEGQPIPPERRWEKRVSNAGILFYMAKLTLMSAQNADEAHNGHTRTEMIMTFPSKNGTTGVQALLQGLGVDTKLTNSHQSQMLALDKEISDGMALVGEEIDWEARLFDKEAVARDKKGEVLTNPDGTEKKGVEIWRLRGMKNFPANGDGTYRHQINLDDNYKLKNGDPLPVALLPARAFNFHRRWVPTSALTKSQALAEAEVVANPTQAVPTGGPAVGPVRQAAAQQSAVSAAGQATTAPVAAPAAAQPARAPQRQAGPVRRVQG